MSVSITSVSQIHLLCLCKNIIFIRKKRIKILVYISSTEQNEDLIKYTKLSKIGKGSFGEVYRVKDKETGQMYVAKISLTEVNNNSQAEMLNISCKVNINASFDHPTVLKFINIVPIILRINKNQ